MGYVTPEQITQAKELDLLTYLQHFAPHQLVHVGGSTYCTREHDSLKISNGKWNWFSRGIGGKTALDYLIKAVLGDYYTFTAKLGGKHLTADSIRWYANGVEAASAAGQPVRHPRLQLSSWSGYRL